MRAHCSSVQLSFQPLARRSVVADFSGGTMTTDAGGLLLREVAEASRLMDRIAGCFEDHRDPSRIEHTVAELVAQRIYGIALGYEDLNDHEQLRRDPLLATLVGKGDPSGTSRARERDRGAALAGKSTLNRLELTPAGAGSEDRYQKIVYRRAAIEELLVDLFLDSYPAAPERIILDLDATDDPLHGEQEGRFFHGYYRCYCYLPLYITCGEHLLYARLRPSNIDASAGSVEALQQIVGQIRARWPGVAILIRADSGFAREALTSWCELEGVDYVLGLARNARLVAAIGQQLKRARRRFLRSGYAARCYREFWYQTRRTWSRRRRVVAKAEYLAKGANPRFVVTSLSREAWAMQALYEDLYCARGDMENRIKEQQQDLFADRTSTRSLRGNQLRLWFSSLAYVLLSELRRVGLRGTELARAQCGTIRLKLLKIGALVGISTRRVWLRCAGGYPYAALFAQVRRNLQRAYRPLRC